MSTQITTAFVEQYRSEVGMLVQQRDSRFSGKVRMESQKGKTEFFEQLGATSAVKRTSRHGDTPRVNSNHQRRAAYLEDYEWSDLIDQQDKIRLIIDPKGPYLQSAAMAFNRSKDDVVIAAATGTSYADVGTGSGAVSPVILPSGQKIAVNYVPTGTPANSGLTLGKLIQAKSLLSAAEPPLGSKKYLAHTQKQLDDMLLNVNQVSDHDYVQIKAMIKGEVTEFMGFEWVRTERIPTASGDINYIFAYVEEGLLMTVGEDFTAEVGPRADKSYSTQVYARMSIGATRMQELEVVEIACDRSP